MNRGSILYVEDSEPQRKALKRALELRGFQVEVAGDVDGARAAIERLGEDLDVLVLDMRLEDPKWPQMTGADVAIEYFNPQTPRPPEFLINSAYSEVDYYKLALKLGVATYLQKAESRQEDLIRHIRALAIRRSLNPNRLDAAERIQRIVESSRNQMDAIIRFCKEELEASFREKLGAPFIFLLTEGRRTIRCAGTTVLPEVLGLYETIQAMVFAEGKSARAFVIEAEKLAALTPPEQLETLWKLNGAAFLPMTISRDLRLSLGLLPDDREKEPLAEPPHEMAWVLSKHLDSTVLEGVISILTRWAEHERKIEISRQAEIIRVSSDIYLYIGQFLQSSLFDFEREFPQFAMQGEMARLQRLASDLEVTGRMFGSITRKEADKRNWLSVSLNEFIDDLSEDQIPQHSFTIGGDCVVKADVEDLFLVFSAVFQWFSRRIEHSSIDEKNGISATCFQDEGHANVQFEDRQARVPAVLRKRIFEPFAEGIEGITLDRQVKPGWQNSMSLYLARVLLMGKYAGDIVDMSDSLTSSEVESEQVGNKLLIRIAL